MEPRPLPDPDSEELAALVGSTSQRLLYGLLYRRRDHPPTMVELRLFAAQALGEDQSQTDRRVRELRRYFDVVAERRDGEHRYVLRGWAEHPAADGAPISLRRRAEVLAPQRCAMCGRTPLEHHVTLVVDHRIPQSWGGSNDVDNLQPLCEDCNAGKRDYFHSFDAHADEIRKAISYDEPQRRIGALLAAFEGKWVRSDLIGIVASAKEYQEDWQRRLRDLRFFGWKIEHQNRHNEGARVRAYYRATAIAPIPDDIPGVIRAETARRKAAGAARSARTLED
ncbi:HNH endonuclease [Leekyejoonella antrihumi]|uniref:HNH endonuclease n=1 Tax=Leekyejoonella antrihumi TaxID=1660198 RepID=A0A563DWL2_9MICO|nr:HNH endonuclease signature motif containing protein [Leekyejoonella antrihumi]TWP34094.1 HNH endonuclease [Leekyejoonella antrihumi]